MRSGSAPLMKLGRDPLAVLLRVAAGIAVLAALVHIAGYLYVAVSRMSFPFALEWVEGSSFVQVSRILAGKPLYVRPSFDFVADIYAPLYFYVSAAASLLLGGGFLPLRLVSFLSSLVILFIIADLVRKQSGSTLAGFLGAALFSATFALTGYWFDVGRVDTLTLALLLLSAYLLFMDGPVSCGLGGAALALSCLTKQTFLALAGVLALFALLPPRRNGFIFLGTAAGLTIVATLALNRISEGWYLYYLFELPSHVPLNRDSAYLAESALRTLQGDAVRPLPMAVLLGIVYWFAFPPNATQPESGPGRDRLRAVGKWPPRSVWVLLLGGTITALISIFYLASLSLGIGGQPVGPSLSAKSVLIAGQVMIAVAWVGLGIRFAKDREFLDRVVIGLYGDIRLVPRLILTCVVVGFTAASIVHAIRPEWLRSPRVDALLPYAAEVLLVMAVSLISWRLIWGLVRLKTWLLIMLAAGLIMASLVAHLMLGSYRNALMPAYAGLSILLGLGIGQLLLRSLDSSSPGWRLAGILALGALAFQFVTMISPLSGQIPSRADAEAGSRLVDRIRSCPVEVYIPFAPYLSEMAGKTVRAGHAEMGPVWLFEDPDPLWAEVRSQMDSALASGMIPMVVATEPYKRFLPQYQEVGRVFEEPDVLWPVTGMRVRSEVIYAFGGTEACDLHVP